jgi:hypothetical protein
VANKKRVRVLPATADRLVTGWAGPGGIRVRLARPGDTDQVTRLLALADLSLDPAVGAVIKAGTVASTLLLGLAHGTNDMLRPLVEAAAAGNPDDAMPGLVLALVAEGRDGSLGGVLQAVNTKQRDESSSFRPRRFFRIPIYEGYRKPFSVSLLTGVSIPQ